MAIEISSIAGNPAHTLRSKYSELMRLSNVDELKAEATRLVTGQPGISQANANKFKATVSREHRLPRLQAYLTNFILAADGLAVIG